MTEWYNGTCPICGATLVIAEGNANRLDCLGEHYSVSREEFEGVWKKYQKYRTWDWDRERLDALFGELDAINQVDISAEEVERLRKEAYGKSVHSSIYDSID